MQNPRPNMGQMSALVNYGDQGYQRESIDSNRCTFTQGMAQIDSNADKGYRIEIFSENILRSEQEQPLRTTGGSR